MPLVPHDWEEFDPALSPPEFVVTAPETTAPVQPPARSSVRRALRIVTNFVVGQGLVQVVGVLGGLFLAHKLSIDSYAQFGLASAFQAVFATLMDLGFASTIIPLVGDRRDDPHVVGRYVRSARHLRNLGFWFLAPIASASFLLIMHKHHWSWTIQILLLISTLVSLYSSGKMSYFSAPLFVFGRLREFYVPQVFTGSMRLLALVTLQLIGGLNSASAAICTALNITVNAGFIHRASRKFFVWPERDSRETDRELLRYILPASPAIVFAAFQSQISLFLVSLFGGTLYIAEVAALSRIGQLFLVLMTFNTVAVEPYVARHGRKHLLRTFAGIALGTSLLCTPIVIAAFVWPGVFLWIIGPRFAGISSSLSWYVLSCCMNLVSGVLWIMNRARRWVFWSGSILEVVLLVCVQVAYLAIFGVKNTHQAALFNVASSGCYLVAHGYVTAIGFMRSTRETTSLVPSTLQ